MSNELDMDAMRAAAKRGRIMHGGQAGTVGEDVAPSGYALIKRALADRIDEQWLKDAKRFVDAVEAIR
jgi:hypothetical protein